MPVQLESLTVEHHPTGLGLDTRQPRLSWRFTADSSVKDWTQTSYEVKILQRGKESSHPVKGEQGKQNVLVPWVGQALNSRERVNVQVRAQGSDSKWTEWKGMELEGGLYERGDWSAKLVGPPKQSQELKRGERVWREFEWDGQGKVARLYSTALGLYVPYLNGQSITDTVLNPGWTSYKHNLRYQLYDLTPLLRKGRNVISADLCSGWYMSRLGTPYGPSKPGKNCLFGDRWSLLAQLEVDGKVIVQTDKSWSYSKSEVTFSELYDGEHVDSNLIDDKWYEHPKEEGEVEVLDFPSGKLQVSDAPPVRRIQERKVEEVIKTPAGKTVLDFGQNFSGWVRINSDLKGTGELLIRHAEVLERGELGTRPLRTAKAEVRIKLGGRTKGFEPKFTFFGFRYAEINGLDSVDPDNFTAIVITSAMRKTGTFDCSHKLINQLHQNADWSLVGNFVSIPTDCPQRDERLGWTGDIQVFAPTANYLYDTTGFLEGWLRDVVDETLEYGGICPEVVPWIYAPWQDGARGIRAMGIWADCTALTPWDLYTTSGDKDLLERNWVGMVAWLERGVPCGSNGLYNTGNPQFGDWLDPRAPPQSPAHGQTDTHLACDAFLVHTTRVVRDIAHVLGKKGDESKWGKQYEELRETFRKEYITPNGRCMSNTQTALALALAFDLFPEHQVKNAADGLQRLVRWDAFRIATGFAGTPIILNTLADKGQLGVAYRMLQEGENPSWLYPVKMGATTIWERWDSMLPDGSINPGQMTSFNHYALGSVAHFLHTVVGGLAPSAPLQTGGSGWKHAIINPRPGGSITHASTSFSSPLGTYSCQWAIKGGKLDVKIAVPPNGSATVIIPKGANGKGGEAVREEVGSGERSYSVDFEEDKEWPMKLIPGPSSVQPKDEACL